MTGRPSDYSQAIADEICEWLADGNSLRTYCHMEGKPSYTTIFRWLDAHESFSDNYVRARQTQAHNDGDSMQALIRALEAGEIAPDVARVMMDGLKWTAGKRLPKVYGDKVQLSGDDAGAPIIVTWATGEKLNN